MITEEELKAVLRKEGVEDLAMVRRYVWRPTGRSAW
jgi:hypothetical protein